MWFQKRKINVAKDFEDRLAVLEMKYNKIKSEILATAMDVDIIRDKVLRKIQFKKSKDHEEEAAAALPSDNLPRIGQ